MYSLQILPAEIKAGDIDCQVTFAEIFRDITENDEIKIEKLQTISIRYVYLFT